MKLVWLWLAVLGFAVVTAGGCSISKQNAPQAGPAPTASA